MYLVIRKWNAICVIVMAAILVAFGGIQHYGNMVQTANMHSHILGETVLIIDAGHGGEDGGALSDSGVEEADINLEIALKAEALAEFSGRETVMTRREDISIHDASCVTLREKKVSDLKNRVALCSGVDNGVLISIHQNSLPGHGSVRGAQVFYNQVSGSRELAEAIQTLLNASVNTRPKSAKAIGSDNYLLNHVSCPAVIVECGFLSSDEDTKLLCDENYQKLLASLILAGAQNHLF